MNQTSILTPMYITRTKLEDSGKLRYNQISQKYLEERKSRLPTSPATRNPHRQDVFIYRNTKYIGLIHQITQYLIIYSRVYVLQPFLGHLYQCHLYLLEFLGFLILLLLSPILILFSIGEFSL